MILWPGTGVSCRGRFFTEGQIAFVLKRPKCGSKQCRCCQEADASVCRVAEAMR